ncbi:hypothetical protein AB0M02_43225 [Actinoplanes sp. NPDC051861]|uniref:hypothetical protein n=1 Tax=Actinoplanes sp. NPDC051861 TaxID=3155170 RepID=UPI00344AC83F
MGVQDLDSQAARTDTGVLLQSLDRETMRLEFAGHTMNLPVERGLLSYGFYLPLSPQWSDGAPISPNDLTVIKQAIVEIQKHWGFHVDFLVLET